MQLWYVAALVIVSVFYFRRTNLKRVVIILMIVVLAAADVYLEHEDVLPGILTQVEVLCQLIYYMYLAAIHQQDMRDSIKEKELDIAKHELLLLRSQIQPDFVFDSLSIIRALAKTDKKASAAAIDSFSFYLRAHLNAIRDDALISMSWELETVKAYLALVEAGKRRTVKLICVLNAAEFELPPLTLEPIVDYCIHQGLGSDGNVTIRTSEDETDIHICISVSGSETPRVQNLPPESEELENVRKRLEMQCGGTLTAENALVTVTIPRQQAE